jgi:hypothetical protein
MIHTDPLLLEFIQAADARCPVCTQPLHAIQDNRCPSCTEDLVLDVGLSDPCTRPLALGALGLGLGFGFNASLGGIILADALRRGFGGVPWMRVLPLHVGAVILAIALIVWVRSKRQIRAMAPPTRRLAVISCWLLSAAFVACLAVNVIFRV